MLMFDVNNSETMLGLKKWWADFCDKAPLADGDMNDYCCVVVGNKIDKSGKNADGLVSESEALEFVDELVPLSTSRPPSEINILPPSSSNGSPVIPYTSLSSSSMKSTTPASLPFPSTSLLPRSSSVARPRHTQTGHLPITPGNSLTLRDTSFRNRVHAHHLDFMLEQ